MRRDDQKLIIDILVKNNLLTLEQTKDIEAEANTSGKTVAEVIESKKIIPEEIFTKIKSKVQGVPFTLLPDKKIDSEILEYIPQELAENYEIIPFHKEGDEIRVAMSNPHNFLALSALDFIARKRQVHFQFFIATPSSIREALRYYEDLKQEVQAAMQSSAAENESAISTEISEPFEGVAGEMVKTAPVSKMVNVILRHAIDGKSSDIHIEPVGQETRVRYRVDGDLHTSLVLPKNVHNAIVARVKVLASLKLDETRLPQDGRFRVNIDGRNVDFRVSTMPLFDQEKVVIRILDSATGIGNLESLGFSGRNIEVMNAYSKQPHGMFLVTGPTGSGKSTTIYALLNILNKEGVNIITLEDPIEYYIPGVNQTQVRPEIGLSFARGLRSILRQDPDIIMVGEVRDNDTAELAVHASLTGHIVLSTLHTNDSFGAVPRLIDMKVEPFLVASSLNVVIAQRLVRMVCNACKAPTKLSYGMIKEVEKELKTIPAELLPKDIDFQKPVFYQGKKCQKCEHTGYKGRTALVEVLEITDTMKQMIVDGTIKNKKLVDEELKKQKMIPIRIDGILKAMRGITTMEEVLTATKS